MKTTPASPVPEFYTTKELAELLKMNFQTIYRIERRGDLHGHMIGRAKRYRRADVEAYLAKCRT